jgi:hypothetical protein
VVEAAGLGYLDTPYIADAVRLWRHGDGVGR